MTFSLLSTSCLRKLPCYCGNKTGNPERAVSLQLARSGSQSQRGIWFTSPAHGAGARFSKVPRTLRARKAFVKSRPAYSVKLIFSHVVKGIKIKITAKFRASRRLRFEDTKRIMSPEIRPKSFGTFEEQAPGHIIKRTINAYVKRKQS